MKETITNMNTNIPTMVVGDSIDSLPTDESPPTETEVQMVENLFKKQHTAFQRFLTNSKKYVVILMLFIAFTLPLIDPLIGKYINTQETPYLTIFVKGLLFTFIYFVFENIHLVKK